MSPVSSSKCILATWPAAASASAMLMLRLKMQVRTRLGAEDNLRENVTLVYDYSKVLCNI